MSDKASYIEALLLKKEIEGAKYIDLYFKTVKISKIFSRCFLAIGMFPLQLDLPFIKGLSKISVLLFQG